MIWCLQYQSPASNAANNAALYVGYVMFFPPIIYYTALPCWIRSTLSCGHDRAVLFIPTRSRSRRRGKSVVNDRQHGVIIHRYCMYTVSSVGCQYFFTLLTKISFRITLNCKILVDIIAAWCYIGINPAIMRRWML